MVLRKSARLSGASKVLPHAHLESMRGTVKQNVDYCGKAETKVAGPWKFGELPVNQGKRTDWEKVKQDALAGMTRAEIVMESPHLAPMAKGIDVLIEAAKSKPATSRTVKVWVLSGPTNTGKTHRAMTAFPDAYLIRGKYFEGKSFDQYNGELVLILDEWDPYEWPLTLMNGLMDKWKCPLQCRFFNKHALWTTVIICTNYGLDHCYPAVPALQRDTFRRRVTHWVDVQSIELPVVDFEEHQVDLIMDDPVLPRGYSPVSSTSETAKEKEKAPGVEQEVTPIIPPLKKKLKLMNRSMHVTYVDLPPGNPRGDFTFRRMSPVQINKN